MKTTINGKEGKEVLKELIKAFPNNVIEKFEGFDYVPVDSVKERLIQVFGLNVSTEIIKTDRFSEKVFVKGNHEEWIHYEVVARLTVRDDLNRIVCVKDGIGVEAKRGGLSVQQSVDTCIKSAYSQAIKIAAVNLGIGLNLYLRRNVRLIEKERIPENNSDSDKESNDEIRKQQLIVSIRKGITLLIGKSTDNGKDAIDGIRAVYNVDLSTESEWINHSYETLHKVYLMLKEFYRNKYSHSKNKNGWRQYF